MSALLAEHRAHPEVTFYQHLASLEQSVADEALGKSRVYLDLKYWIFLRDADLGNPQRPLHVKLLNTILEGVAQDRFVCPITEAVLFELDRQGNTERRMQTVRMIDKLCRGIVIKNSAERCFWEVQDFFEYALKWKSLPDQPSRRVWVRPYSFLGTPQLRGFGKLEDLAVNKAFLSYMWTRSLEDLLTDTPVPDDSMDAASREIAMRITESSSKKASEMRSFEKVYSDEVGGLVERYRNVICDSFRPHASELMRSVGAASFDLSVVDQQALDFAFSVASAKKPNRAFPLIRVLAGLHAFIRWQRTRAFKFEDFFDLRHAAAAIPYCDIFLTESFLKTACTSKLLDFASVFGTRIISDEDEALEAVSRISVEQNSGS